MPPVWTARTAAAATQPSSVTHRQARSSTAAHARTPAHMHTRTVLHVSLHAFGAQYTHAQGIAVTHRGEVLVVECAANRVRAWQQCLQAARQTDARMSALASVHGACWRLHHWA